MRVRGYGPEVVTECAQGKRVNPVRLRNAQILIGELAVPESDQFFADHALIKARTTTRTNGFQHTADSGKDQAAAWNKWCRASESCGPFARIQAQRGLGERG